MINYPSPLFAVYENNCLLRKLTLLIGDFGNLIRIVPYLLLVLWLTTVVHISNFTCVLNISTFKNPSLVFSLNLSSDRDPHEIIKLQSINNLNFSPYHALWRSLFTFNVSKPLAETSETGYCGEPSAPQNIFNLGSGSKPSALPVSGAVRPSASAALEGVRPSASPSAAVRPSASADLEGVRPSASPSHNPDPCLQPSAWLNCSPLAQGPSYSTTYTQKLRLPASLDSQKTSIFSLDGPLNLVMEAATESTERTIIECLVKELNLKFNAGLDPDPVHLTPAGYQKMADKIVEMGEAHRVKLQQLAPVPAKCSHPRQLQARGDPASAPVT